MGSVGERAIAVVVPLHNRADRVRRLVAALEAQNVLPDEVVLVDDGSTDSTLAVARREAERSSLNVRVIALPTSEGPARARNTGWKAASADLVAFTDDDCVPSAEWLRAGAAPLADDAVGIVQGTTLPAVGAPLLLWHATRRVTEPSPFFEGCNLFLRRPALEATGGFNESLRMGAEDTWLGWAVAAAGWSRAFSVDAVVHHDVTYPGYRWHLRQAWMEGKLVTVAAEFPELRGAFWRPWAFRREHATMALAWVGIALTPKVRSAAALALPYAVPLAWRRRVRWPDAEWVRHRAMEAALDAAAVAGMVTRSIRHRTVLL